MCLWLSSLGAKVTGVSLAVPTDPSHFGAAMLAGSLQDCRLDIRDGIALRTAVREFQPDFVFHLAAQPLVKRSHADPVETWQTNVLGTVNILESLRELRKTCVAVFITSDKCYDNVNGCGGIGRQMLSAGRILTVRQRELQNWRFVPT